MEKQELDAFNIELSALLAKYNAELKIEQKIVVVKAEAPKESVLKKIFKKKK